MSLGGLFLAHVDGDGGAGEVPLLADLVLEVAAVGLLDPLRKVAEEDEGGYLRALEHGYVFYLDVLALVRGWRIGADDLEQVVVELRCRNDAAPVLVDVLRGLENLEDALFCQGRAEDDGEIVEGRETSAYGILEMLDGLLALVLGDVPFVYNYDEPFLVALDKREDADVLCLDAACGVNHEYADVGGLDGADRADYRVVLDILVDLVLLADAGCVDEVEVEAELVVARVDGVACRAGDVGDDVAVLADEGVDQR